MLVQPPQLKRPMPGTHHEYRRRSSLGCSGGGRLQLNDLPLDYLPVTLLIRAFRGAFERRAPGPRVRLDRERRRIPESRGCRHRPNEAWPAARSVCNRPDDRESRGHVGEQHPHGLLIAQQAPRAAVRPRPERWPCSTASNGRSRAISSRLRYCARRRWRIPRPPAGRQAAAGNRNAALDQRADFLGLFQGGDDPALDLRLVVVVARRLARSATAPRPDCATKRADGWDAGRACGPAVDVAWQSAF